MNKWLVFSVFITVMNPVWAMDIKITDTRENNFYMDALVWVLDKSGESYHLIQTKHDVTSQGRKVLLVQSGKIDILYAGTSIELEKELRPIRFPIMRGLIGSRLFIIHKDYQAKYHAVKSINDLKKFVGVQGIGWGDKQVLESSGLQQEERLYDDIFGNINSGSRYYFPRGMTEIFSELKSKQATLPNLAVEQNILLVYKTAVFFFINPSNTALEKALNQGFKNAYADGSYEQFFYNHALIKSAFEEAKLDSRIKLEIPNPFLSPETVAVPKQYWHQD